MTRNDRPEASYFSATRHPWSCVLFVLPLIAIYEIGIQGLGPAASDAHRNGAEVWLRDGLASLGIAPSYGAPSVLLFILLGWGCLRRADRPTDHAGVWAGVALESVIWGLLLFALSQGLGLLAAQTRQICASWPGVQGSRAPELELMIRYLGAGIYEETLFRLVGFAGLLTLLKLAELPGAWSFLLAAGSSALTFAWAHHVGPGGEPFDDYVFAFRTCAGVYFAWLFQVRGFGIAVGAHACYDVLVGLVMR